MDLRSGILSTAQALGINPLDLATAISYETAGTFDPTKAGPTTQWGQHRGLIQFGEPQAKKYGVDWANPVASQLGPQGAVANYLRDTGVRPGMGLLDIYSAINAGGVGRYNRSDANNGGAPGTVRDKVEKQMAGHRQKALALLGAIDQPQQTISTNSPQTEAPMQDQKATGLLGSLFPNMTADRQDRLAVALSGLSMHPNQGIVQMAGQRMADRREDNKAAQARTEERQQTNRTIAWLETQAQNNPNAAQALQMLSQGVIDARGALQLAMQQPEAKYRQVTGATAASMGLDPNKVYNIGPDNKISGIGGGDTVITNNMGPTGVDYGNPGNGLVWQRDQSGNVVTDERGAPIAIPYQGGPVWNEQAQAARGQAETDKAQQEQQATTDNVVLNQVNAIRDMLNNGGIFDLPEVGIVGNALGRMGVNQEAVNMRNRLATLEGMVSFDQLARMRAASPTGGALGAISERELTLLSAQLGTLAQSSDAQTIKETLDLLESVMRKADAYPNAAQFGFGGTSNGKQTQSMSNEDLLRKYGYID